MYWLKRIPVALRQSLRVIPGRPTEVGFSRLRRRKCRSRVKPRSVGRARNPYSPACGYGFRARRFAAPRNDRERSAQSSGNALDAFAGRISGRTARRRGDSPDICATIFWPTIVDLMIGGAGRNDPVSELNQNGHIGRQGDPKPELARSPDKEDRNASNPPAKPGGARIDGDATPGPGGHERHGGPLCRPGRSVRRRSETCPRGGVGAPSGTTSRLGLALPV